MFTLISQGGLFGMLILILIIIAAAYFAVSVFQLVKLKKGNDARIEDNINNILRMGVMSAALGFLGTIHGGYLAFVAISRAHDVSMEIVYNGIICALSTTVLGFYVFAATAIIWFVLRNISSRMN